MPLHKKGFKLQNRVGKFYSFMVLIPFICEGALRHRNTKEFYSKNLRAIGPNHAQLCTSVEDETEQKTRQQNTGHKDQNNSIKNQPKHPCANTFAD